MQMCSMCVFSEQFELIEADILRQNRLEFGWRSYEVLLREGARR